MRLTSLTISGFKSFGERVTLEFAPGVTAIVGPNGSGKSNVIDALRWATGGGRASEYRAGDKSELIFHGAAGKKSVSFAEVEIELGGSGRPINIARNLYRDGQTKLRLNGKNARFLDLEEELSGSGLGRGGLALIGQGEVSQVLVADPAKLLSYVAEAAGVAKFAVRREQTHARLETTREHLGRLEDLMRELKRQLEQLHQEAAQAERAATLSREVLQLRYTLSHRRVQGLETERAALLSQQGELEAAVATARGELEAAQTRWQRDREDLATLEEEYRRALTAAEARRGDLRVAEERLANVVTRRQALEDERWTLEQELARLEGAAPPAPPEGDAEKLEGAQADAAARRATTQSAVAEAEAALQTVSRQLETARLELGRAREAVLAYERQRRDLGASLVDIDGRLAGLDTTDDGDLADREDERRKQVERLEAAQSEIEALREVLAQSQRLHAGALAEAQALDRAARRARSAFEARQGYAQGPRQALTSGIEGVIGSVADLVRVPDEYELAIGSALGRRAENVVVENAAVAQRVVAHLKRSGGWVTVLPLDLLEGRNLQVSPSLMKEPGVIGLASEMVTFEERYGPVIRQLLGGTLLVGTMDQAVALARRHRQRPRLVTLEGDLLESFGAISGGRRQLNTGLLGLAAEVERAEEDARNAAEEAERLGRALTGEQETFRHLQTELQAIADEVKELERTITQGREQAAARRSLRDELTQRRSDLAAQLDRMEPPVSPDGEAGLADLESARDRAQAELETRRAAAATSIQHEAEARQHLAVYRERQEAFRRDQRRFDEERQRLTTLRDRHAKLLLGHETAAEEQRAAEAAVTEARAAIPKDLSDMEAAYHEAKGRNGEAETSLRALTQAQAERGAHLEEVRLTLARREAALELAREELAGFPAGLAPREDSQKSLREALTRAENELTAIGPVNHRARQDHDTQRLRLDELEAQATEAGLAAHELESVLQDIDQETNARLAEGVTRLRGALLRHVRQLFGPDAQAAIEVHRDEGRHTGLTISLQPPGKQTRSLNLLSVGERTMGALAFLFALMGEGEGQRLPIAVLDEVDAPLDEANIRRFRDFLQRLAGQGTQFVLITHQKATMEVADALWGVTSERGVSRVFSISRADSAVLG